MSKINIRTEEFTKNEIRVVEECAKEWNNEDLFEIVYVGESNNDNLDLCFIVEEEDLGSFLSFLFACGHESVHRG